MPSTSLHLRRAGAVRVRPGCSCLRGRGGRLRDESGMTIMELLVGAGIALIVVGTVFQAMRVQGRSAAYETGMADAQLTSRGAGELLLQDLRMAGFGMLGVSPANAAVYPPLSVVTAGTTTTLTLRGAFSNVTTTLAGSANAGQTTLNVNTPATGAFSVGNLVLVDSGLSSEMFPITGVSGTGATRSITIASPLQNNYPVGPFVTQIEVVTYVYGPQGGTLRLQRNNQVVAENMPTFQMQYVDNNGTVSPAPGTNVRSVTVVFDAAQASQLPDSPTAKAHVATEANMRNLAFRFSLNG